MTTISHQSLSNNVRAAAKTAADKANEASNLAATPSSHNLKGARDAAQEASASILKNLKNVLEREQIPDLAQHAVHQNVIKDTIETAQRAADLTIKAFDITSSQWLTASEDERRRAARLMVASSILTALDTAETAVKTLQSVPRPTTNPAPREAAETALMAAHSIRDEVERALTPR